MWIWQKNHEGENWETEVWKPMNPSHFSLHFPTPARAHSGALTVPMVLQPPPPSLPWSFSWANALEYHLLSPDCARATLWALAAPEGIPKSSQQVSCFSLPPTPPQLLVLLTVMMFTLCVAMVCLWVCIPPFAKFKSMSYSWLNLQAWGTIVTR